MVGLASNAKLYCRIGEVAQMTGLKPSVLRFWETEFPEIAPQKSSTGQRIYSRQNIAVIMQIKELLYQEKLTIAGARSRLQNGKNGGATKKPSPGIADSIIAELLEIKKILLM